MSRKLREKTINIPLGNELLVRLEQAAKEQHVNRCNILRIALLEYLNKNAS